MLNFKFLFILLSIHSGLPMKKDTKLGKKPSFPKQANCETMKCPSVEQPICAKLVYRNAGNKTAHVVMVNQCEMSYVKCHEGLDAVVVPMKSCGHNHFIKSGSKRSKREVEEEGNEENNEQVNLKEYYSDCPTVCPSRDVMVCARCQHGVFRTFLSVCHMRMFRCRHTDESLDLIARVPCVMSAPYLSDAFMQPTGRVREPNDADRVLRYLRCRELSKMSREGDPRCKIMNDQDTKMMVEKFVDDDY